MAIDETIVADRSWSGKLWVEKPGFSGLLLLVELRVDDSFGMERAAHPGSLGMTRFLPWNQSPSRGFLFSEHRELSEVTRPASKEYTLPRWLGPAFRVPPNADAGP